MLNSVYAPQPLQLPSWHTALPPGFNPTYQPAFSLAIPPTNADVLPTYADALLVSVQPSAPSGSSCDLH